MPRMKLRSGYATTSDGEDGEAGADDCLKNPVLPTNIPEKSSKAPLEEMKTPSSPPPQPDDAYLGGEQPWVPATLPSCVPRSRTTVAPQQLLRRSSQSAAARQFLPPCVKEGEQVPANSDLSFNLHGQTSSDSGLMGSNTSTSFPLPQMMAGDLPMYQMAPTLYSEFDFSSQAPLSIPPFDLSHVSSSKSPIRPRTSIL
ncbi:hypothetical protein BD289DRAFT_92268 [Coniella lustricola]|uniref:Uncharacterized protein n=1 Tax=Coniella lustricola TaxID=2025994 RepID=A0A2T3AH41_9PEZI|nr:hypothetical protein BD289DRAFT_92268 [Coniella lustricola]